MSIDQILTGLIYLLAVFALFWLGKLVYDRLHPRYELRRELFENDNFALSIEVVGYYLGLVFALGGVLDGPSLGWIDDLIDLLIYGPLAIVLLNVSAWINDRVVLSAFDNTKEVIDDRNAGAGAVEAGSHIANGLIVAGAVSGEGGDLITAVVFWALGQIVLIVAGRLYTMILPFDLQTEIERDNVAVGVAFAGVLVALGNVVRLGIYGDFSSWAEHLGGFGIYALVGLALLPLVRVCTDLILVPGVRLSAELVEQQRPNVGAGLIEAFSYLAASMLIGWTI